MREKVKKTCREAQIRNTGKQDNQQPEEREETEGKERGQYKTDA